MELARRRLDELRERKRAIRAGENAEDIQALMQDFGAVEGSENEAGMSEQEAEAAM